MRKARKHTPVYRERYDLCPMEPRVRFIRRNGGCIEMGHVVVPVFMRRPAADKAARAAIANLKG